MVGGEGRRAGVGARSSVGVARRAARRSEDVPERAVAEGADTLSGDVTPPGFREIQRQELSRLFGRALSLRTAAIVPLGLVYLLVLLTDPAPWRAWFLGANIVLLAIVAVGGLKNPYLDPRQSTQFTRSYLGWRSRVALNLLQRKRYQENGAFAARGAAAPELGAPR